PQVERFARLMILVFMAQLGAGLMNLLLRAPIAMQLVHLLLADLLWISLVLLAASALAEGVPRVELAALASDRSLSGALGGEAVAAPVIPTSHHHITGHRATWRDYLALTKPRVISLLLFTTLTAMFIAAGGRSGPGPGMGLCLAVAIGFYMAAGA